MAERVYLYPIWIRIWHIINALLCLLLIVTGISMQYATPAHGFIRFDIAVSIHNTSGVILTVSYLFFFLGNFFTRNGRHYRLEPIGLFKRLWKQARYYSYGVFKNEEPPFPIGKDQKFNPLQKISYGFVMYVFVPLIIITGWGMLFPETIIKDYLGLNGFLATDILHLTAAFVISVFLIIHLYFATMGRTPSEHYKAMITGYHEEHDE
ncbi:MAG: cytochrome b/b6 domain-containing protein [Bacteroidales bacterium]|nr:cytochrome b/b6 domain-containing protein [Bacteroidales bacterium]